MCVLYASVHILRINRTQERLATVRARNGGTTSFGLVMLVFWGTFSENCSSQIMLSLCSKNLLMPKDLRA